MIDGCAAAIVFSVYIKGKSYVGYRSSKKAGRRSQADYAHAGKGAVSNIYIAEDADFFVIRAVIEAATAADIPIISVDSKKELGRMCGIEIGTATAGTLI